MAEERNISEKVKQYLERKLQDCRNELIKLKRKRKKIKVLYVTTVVSLIVISAVTISLTSPVSTPIIVITVLSPSSAILMASVQNLIFKIKKLK